MKLGARYKCDTCGNEAPGIVPTHHVNVWPPERWLWGFGWKDIGPHACSRVCWKSYQRRLWESGHKFYVSDYHRRWDLAYPPPTKHRDGGPYTIRLAPEHLRKQGSVDLPTETPVDSLTGTPVPDLIADKLRTGEQRWRREKNERVIFFAQQGEDGPIKIGFSWRVAERLLELGAAAGKTLRLLGTMPGDKKTKMMIKAQFQDWQLGGEWFVPSDDVLDFIMKNAELVNAGR